MIKLLQNIVSMIYGLILPPYCCFESNKLQNFNLWEERFIEDNSVTQ